MTVSSATSARSSSSATGVGMVAMAGSWVRRCNGHSIPHLLPACSRFRVATKLVPFRHGAVPCGPMTETLAPASAPEVGVSPAPEPLIHARGLTKRFGELTAVDAIDFDVAKGESFGFLGPNGAGKTSTMRMIGCVSPATAGTLRILDQDPAVDGPRIRARLGVVPQQDTLDTELTVRENLLIYGRYFGLSRSDVARRADELLDFAQLTE